MSKQAQTRPISPHLAIYKMQITSALSIMHRATGIFLFIGLLFILWWIVYFIASYDIKALQVVDIQSSLVTSNTMTDCMFRFMSTAYGKLILIAWSYCLFYHTLAGVRHLLWDMNKGFNLKISEISGWIVLTSSVVLTAFCWLYALI